MKPAAGLLILFIFCLFMGVTAISIGLGAAFPAINTIAKPFVCADGVLESDQQIYRPYPGKTITTRTWFCTSASGEKVALSAFPMSLYAGLMYGVLLFVILFALMLVRGRRRNA